MKNILGKDITFKDLVKKPYLASTLNLVYRIDLTKTNLETGNQEALITLPYFKEGYCLRVLDKKISSSTKDKLFLDLELALDKLETVKEIKSGIARARIRFDVQYEIIPSQNQINLIRVDDSKLPIFSIETSDCLSGKDSQFDESRFDDFINNQADHINQIINRLNYEEAGPEAAKTDNYKRSYVGNVDNPETVINDVDKEKVIMLTHIAFAKNK